MSPDCLPAPQRGMVVEQASLDDARLGIRTTGAEFELDLASGGGRFRQRIGGSREVLGLTIQAGPLSTPRLTHAGPGLAFAEFDSPRLDLRANGDSLFMLHARQPVRLSVAGRFAPGFFSSDRANHLVLDERGGFGLYCSVTDLADRFDPFGEPGATASYDLPAGAVLWIGICPPKPYDWERSTRDQVVWHWSNTLAYPADGVLEGWARLGNIVLLQSEVMLWKDWNLAFEPRLGPGEFARVGATLHRLGMRFIVYTSPYYFLRGTGREKAAMNSFEHFTNWPAGTPTGENIEAFLAEIARLMRDHRPDGLYFDGQYTENPAALYLLARRSREIVGEGGLLEWHSTTALGSDLCSLPAADAYVDFVLRGEGRQKDYGSRDYLRYFVSGANVHNSVGVICNNGGPLTPGLVHDVLDVNARMHTLAGWMADPKSAAVVDEYRHLLGDGPGLRDRFERGCERHQGAIPGQVELRRRERRMLAAPPEWGRPLWSGSFASLDGWSRIISPRNPDPFAAAGGTLRITAAASTYAYLQRPVGRPVRGLLARIRRGSDTGASWGPAVGLRWPDEDLLRIGLRGDGLVQLDTPGNQRLAAPPPGADVGLWLRARWGEHQAIVEIGPDRDHLVTAWSFEHQGRFVRPVIEAVAGKVPYHGRPEDFSEPGPTGTCEISWFELYP
jgi:hypothetical protein